jgi:hypothetical protein|tara:strand:- start:794 stop:1042 length:249 start_codon:yes stop_codon:yes gene_type:complete
VGRIFKTPSDDAVEETLRSMHIANTVDVAYERAVGWIKVVIFSLITAFVISAFEFYTDWNLWEVSGNWLKDTLSSWADSIFD